MTRPLDIRGDDILAVARPGRAFSNGFEYESWFARSCATCTHDDIERGGDVGCPLIMFAMIGAATPAQWVSNVPNGLADRYICSEHEARA